MTDAEKVAAIEKIVEGVAGTHRNRLLRDAWQQVVAIIAGDEPVTEPEDAPEDPPERPPVTGPGSSAVAWKTYAEAIGIDVPEGATKTAIVALIAGD